MAVKQRKGKKKGADKEKQRTRDTDGKKPTLIKPPTQQRNADRMDAICLFLIAFLTYVSSGGIFFSGDAVGNIFLPLQFLRGKFSWNAYENPKLFLWRRKTGEASFEDVYLSATMDDFFYNKDRTRVNMTAQELNRQGQLYYLRNKYYMVPITRDANKTPPRKRYVNTFNIGTGITFTPVVSLLALFYGFDLNSLQKNDWLLFYSGRVTASLLVAASGAFIFLSARTFSSVTRMQALMVAFIYCFCTCTWSLSSQTLWQHAPNEFYISVAVFALLTAQRRHADGRGWSPKMAALCGFSVGMATLSRPTSAVVAVSIGSYFLLQKRSAKMSVIYAAAGALLAALQLYYNWFCFDNPFQFGQQQASKNIAKTKTGSPDLWQTPIMKGAAMLLFSPSRGLFVFSPLTVFTIPAFYLVWLPNFRGKEETENWFGSKKTPSCDGNEFEALRPLSVSVFILWITAFKFFDHWGGWCYGYRPLLDTMPMLILFLCVVINKIEKYPKVKYALFVMTIWSISVQYVGANACTNFAWNARKGWIARLNDKPSEFVLDNHRLQELKEENPSMTFKEVTMDIDEPEYRHRLWSWSDWQILYYMHNYQDAKKLKRLQSEFLIKFP